MKNIIAKFVLVMLVLGLTGCIQDYDNTFSVIKTEVIVQSGLDAIEGRALLLATQNVDGSMFSLLEKVPSNELLEFFKKLKKGDKVIVKGHYYPDSPFFPIFMTKGRHKMFVFDEIIVIGSGERYKR